MIDALQGLWHGLLDALGQFIIPDWGALIGLLPILLVLLVVGPLLSLIVLGWLIYVVRRPRTSVAYADGPVYAPLAHGVPVWPTGEPYCPTDRLVYRIGQTACDRCGRDLTIRCPKCAAGRSALLDACGNCGLVLKMARRSVALRRAGPPPGGAAAA